MITFRADRLVLSGRMTVCAVLILSLTVQAPAEQRLDPEPVPLSGPHPDAAALEATFEQAAEATGVPAILLKAVAFQESRWSHAGPTIDNGFGIMHLVDNSYSQTLDEAAALSGFTADQLKSDPIANIHASAMLIAHYVTQTVGEAADLIDYWDALKLFTGLLPAVQEMQVHEYYRIMNEGATATNSLGMEIVIEPLDEPVELPTAAAPADDDGIPVFAQQSDYPGAVWDPAHSSNYSTSRGTISRWVNHWIGVGTFAGTLSWFKNPESNVSAHFVIRKSDGHLVQMVRIHHTAWHCGSACNPTSIGIEHEAHPDNPWPTSPTSPMLVKSADVCRHFCDLYGIPKTRTYIIGHQEAPAATQCPGPLPWDVYMDLVTQTPPAGPTIIIEARSGGQNHAWYSEQGAWADSSGTSTAAGMTPGIGSRYSSTFRSVVGVRSATFAPNFPSSGIWRVSVTWPTAANRMDPILYQVTHAGGTSDFLVNQTINQNTWVELGEFAFTSGFSGSVRMSNEAIDASGSMYASGVRFQLIDEAPDPPSITGHPGNQNVCPNGTASFSVSASGSGSLSYQWQHNNSNLSNGGGVSGATTATLQISGVDGSRTGNYRCVVTNAGGSTNSNQASLTLRSATSVTGHPQPQSGPWNGAAQFSASGTGDGAVSYQWQHNGANLSNDDRISGATSATLTINGLRMADQGDYRCVITAGCGSATSNAAALTLTSPPGDFDSDGDVDMADFGYLQACLSGANVPQTDPACEAARLDADSDVDEDDILLFLNCLSGSNVPGDLNCAL